MKNWRKLALAGSVLLPSLMMASEASAVVCAVNAHVIQRTIELEQKVKAQIDLSENLLIMEERRQREMLLSALKVITKQESGSGQQTAMVVRKSAEAAANVNTTQRQAYAIADARERYGSTGYNSCDLQSKGQKFYAANQAARSKAQAVSGATYFKPGSFDSPRSWSQFATSNRSFDGESLFRGGQAARDYINLVVGPPIEDTVGSGAERNVFVLDKNRRDARRSVSKEVMASIAAEYEPGGARASLEELTKHWTGDDGGEKWASAMSDKPFRAALLDAVRIEAANIAVMAYQAKGTARTELALSSYALARINQIVQGGSSLPVVVSNRPEQRADVRQ
ncbi:MULTISPECIES: hypothetical protein [Hyphomicrobiales]|uniref:hypothetical protein n=2 Tax=Hyphomicrobiales TaxID=356 RepID=UPI000F9D7F09|nr:MULTISPECIES: hypothetical protein [Hyphomicrobiales]MCQ9147383.1 hypothetical protein [Ochrobactrum sp. BTU2]MDH1270299.1 hypothetical protein [Agrobacterium pusense]RSC24754.1 hypothetical protein EGT36_28415 [Agrobacterium sp. FDAARGOS_525]